MSGDEPSRPLATEGPAPGTAIGRFIVLGKLGSGGMGLVLLAYDAVLDRKVAIKLIRSAISDERAVRRTARLQREAQALAKIAHRNVLTVYEVGRLEDQIF